MVRSIFPSVRGNANHALDHRFYFTKAMPMHYLFRLLKNILLTIEINFRDGEILDAYDANYLSPMAADRGPGSSSK